MATPTTVKSKNVLPMPKMLPPDDPTAIIIETEDESGNILSVPTKMNYVNAKTEEIHVRRDVSGSDAGFEFNQDGHWEPVALSIHNARDSGKTLEQNGFELLSSPLDQEIDFLNTEDVIDNYYPSCEQLLQKVFGDKKVTVKAFDHNIRINSSTPGGKLKGGGEAKAQVPLGLVNGDYTKKSGPTRLENLGQPPKVNDVLKRRLGETPLMDSKMVQETHTGKRRFALINVWRSIDTENPIQGSPLACADASTVSKDDLRVLKIHYSDRVGQNYVVAHSPKHDWCYFPQMIHDEAMLIKQWDSFGSFALNGDNDTGRSTFAIHSAFLDPTTPEDAAPRKSIEVRCALIWEEED